METLGIIRVGVKYNYRNPYQPHPSEDRYLQYSEVCDSYMLDGYRIDSDAVELCFWVDNAAHASFGVWFVKSVIKEPTVAKQQEFWSCGEGLCLEYIPKTQSSN